VPNPVPGPDPDVGLGLLRTFLAIHRAGSITRAAGRLGLSQSTVSAQLQALERQVGRPLFERLARGVAPTAAGDDLARAAAPHLDALAGVAAVAAEGGSAGGERLAGPLRLGGPAELLAARVLPALAPLTAAGVRLRVTLGLAGALLDALAGLPGSASDELDLVVATARSSAGVRGDADGVAGSARRGLRFEPLYTERFILVGPPELAARVDPADLAARGAVALAGLPLVAYGEELPIVRRYWRVVFAARVGRSPALVVPDLRAVAAAVAAGHGVSVLPRYLVADDLAAGRLAQLYAPPDPPGPPANTIFLATRAGTLHRPRLAAAHRRLLVAARGWA